MPRSGRKDRGDEEVGEPRFVLGGGGAATVDLQDIELGSGQGPQRARRLGDAVAKLGLGLAHTPADAEAIAIGGNGFRAVGTIAALEEQLERPVVTANQALLWAALGAAGADTSTVSGYGRLFERKL